MGKITEFNGQYRITIPKELVDERRWKAGTKLKFTEDTQNNIFLKEVKK